MTISILFVCTGNICRSPTAEGVFRDLVHARGLEGEIRTASAGTTDYHTGEGADQRALSAAKMRGCDLSRHTARQVVPEDYERFDLILAMDRGHLDELRRLAPPGREDRVRLFMDYAPEKGAQDVPDPYYGGDAGFEHVLDLIEAASEGLLRSLTPQIHRP